MKKEKLIIVDLDGTLFDTVEVNFRAYKKALNNFGFDIKRDYYAKHCNGAHYKRYLPQIIGADDEDLIIRIHDQKKEVYSEFLYTAKKNLHLFEILEGLKQKYHIAVVTTASRKNAEEILDFFSVRDLFDLLITQEDVTYVKPNPEGFLKVMNHFNAHSENTMIFEDSEDGIQAALNCNCTVFRLINQR